MALADLLDAVRTNLAALRDSEDKQDEVRELMRSIYDLYLFLIQLPDGRTDEVLTMFVDQAREPLQSQLWAIEVLAVGRLEILLNSVWEADEWVRVCRERSAIAALNEIFGSPDSPLIDTAELDESIRAKGDDEGFLDPSRIPPGMPAEHWWWHLHRE
jgi:hypothetical protein